MLKKTSLIMGLMMAAQVAYAEIVVVVHPSNSNAIDSKLVQRIYLGKEDKFADGTETIAVNQNVDTSIRQTFDESIVGRSSSQIAAYWSKLVFTGKGIPPKEVASDAEVIDLVSKNPNVIGYIDSASVTGDVKVVAL
ncbi:phosphate ABC transporter substrate-binding protein [Glaciecola sp. 2405UD65-10]|uniref:phosphate ABC transporter substrate-binding protein n=1 Tax=Glaciecola sp. 2405UD65-10 TaxID=3397244 RepID=UPI003B59FFB4